MYSDNIKQKTKDVKIEINEVLIFISKNLPCFKINFLDVIKSKEEQCYNKQLLIFLDRKLRYSNKNFIIEGNQINEAEKYPDIEFLSLKNNENKSFFDIECKRLNSKLKHVEQYVNGKTGGIQRFKENKHGVDLPHSAMIGYVENEDLCFWHTKVNSWINDKNEHLKIIESSPIGKLESKHPRNNSQISTVTLTHFWLKIMSNATSKI